MKTRKEFFIEEMSDYMDSFYASNSTTNKGKWEEAETAYQKENNRPKFTSYGSFRVAKSKYINELQDKVRRASIKRKTRENF